MTTQRYVINVFCDKGDLYNLIKKAFDERLYDMRYNIEINPDKGIKSDCDCVIIDKGIEKNLRGKIIKKFRNIPIVCLPSLYNEISNGSNMIYISEPLKLSELKKTIEELLLKGNPVSEIF
jgi:hypothetical protein